MSDGRAHCLIGADATTRLYRLDIRQPWWRNASRRALRLHAPPFFPLLPLLTRTTPHGPRCKSNSKQMFAARAWVSFFAVGLCRVALVSAQTAPPPIISPRSGDVWTVGEIQTVKWSTTGIQVFQPDGKTPLTGQLWLGHLTNTSEPGSSGYWLWVDEPLSVNFPLSTGQVDVMVPEVPTGSVYLVGSE
ncbi:hypothetical protein C8Q70DRAFT_553319 [Cubamyces menziesii]|nr:hypothetical protein C8Q70DRAFT_553319 [Cubamyces menziesii]